MKGDLFRGLAAVISCDPLGWKRGVEPSSCVIHVGSDPLLGIYLEDRLSKPKTVGLDSRPPVEDLHSLSTLGLENISPGQCFYKRILGSIFPMSYFVY